MKFQTVLDSLVSKDTNRIVRVGKSPVWDYKIQNNQLRLIHGDWPNETSVSLDQLIREVDDMSDISVVDEETLQEFSSFKESSRTLVFNL